MLIGLKIKELRIERGLMQNEVAKAIKVTPEAVSSWEKGKSNPGPHSIKRLAVFFDVDIKVLTEDYIEESKNSSEQLLEELRSTLDYVKGQIDNLNEQLAASTTEKSRLLDVIDRLTVNFPEGSTKASLTIVEENEKIEKEVVTLNSAA